MKHKPRERLTAKNIHTLKLPPGKLEHIYHDRDIHGFQLRIRTPDSGDGPPSRTLSFVYKLGAKQRRFSFGAAKTDTFDQVRKSAAKLSAKVKLGEDPAGAKHEARAVAHRTFGVVVEDFLAHQQTVLRPSSFGDMQRHLREDARQLHRLNVGQITKGDVAACLASVRKRAMPTGNRVRSSLSSFFAWCVEQDYAQLNPVVGTKHTTEAARTRVLSPDELRVIWSSLPDNQYGAIIKLLALTGARREEIGGLCWSEVNLEKREIRLPGERTKNSKPHTIALSDPALEILQGQPRRPGRDLVFGNAGGPFGGWSKCKRQLDEAITKALGQPLPDWRHHDLRRSASTHMCEQVGVLPHVVEQILNHAASGHKAGVASVYNYAVYANETRRALDQWAVLLLAWVRGEPSSNVVPMQRSA